MRKSALPRALARALALLAPLLTLLSLMGLLLTAQAAHGAERQWRMAYVDGGRFVDSAALLHSTARALQLLGLREVAVPRLRDTPDIQSLWQALAVDQSSPLRFLADGFYSGDWDIQKRADNKAALQRRIAEKNDVDIILAFGTPAGLDMMEGMGPVPVLVMGATDPVQAGIIPSADNSGRDNVHASVIDTPRREQLQLFHNLFGFQRLGICYENSREGRSAIAYDDIRAIATGLGFELVEGHISNFTTDEDDNIDLRIQCHQSLARDVDAFYLTLGKGNGRQRFKELLAPLLAAKLPTFSQSGRKDVEAGALLSYNDTNMAELGLFQAKVIQSVYQGQKLRQIPQVFTSAPDLTLNIKNAAVIGWKVTPRILSAVDEVYTHIQNVTQANVEEASDSMSGKLSGKTAGDLPSPPTSTRTPGQP